LSNAWKYKFTVLTPTYNRAHTLPRVYESLKKQTFRDFEWIIVDDGSKDNTRDVVAKWKHDGYFPIRYLWQKNFHKKTAFNLGVKAAKGRFVLPLDSDDEMLPEAMEKFNYYWKTIPENQREIFTGVTGLCQDKDGAIIGNKFPLNIFDSNSLETFYKYRITGEKYGFHRTDVLKKFPFPESVEGLVPESIVWSAISLDYKTRYVNEVLRVYHAENDSITLERDISKKSDGFALWSRDVLCNQLKFFIYKPIWFMYIAANYTRFHIHLNFSKYYKLNSVLPFLFVCIMFPAGVFLYFVDKIYAYYRLH